MEKIKKEDIKFKKFFSKYNTLKDELEKKNAFLTSSLSLFKTQVKFIDSIIKDLNLHSKFLSNIDNKNKDDIYEIIKLIIESIEMRLNLDSQLIKELITNLTKLVDNFNKYNKKIDLDIEPLYNQMKDYKEKTEKHKIIYFDTMKKTELYAMFNIDELLERKKQLPIDDTLQNYEILREPKINYLNYRMCLGNANKIISELNNKEKCILDYFDDVDNNYNLVISNILTKFYENQNIKNSYISNNINLIKNMIINNNNILDNKSKDNYLSLNKYFFDLIEMENFPSSINFLDITCDENYIKCKNTVEFLNESIGNVYPNFSAEEENKRNTMREKISNIILHNNKKISDEDKNFLLEELKINEENQNLFINIMNRLRINGKFKLNKEVNYLIGKALNIILDYLSINKNYDIAKNCILLSQTLYYEDDNKKKKYIFELIKDNEYLHDEHFWRNFIDLSITNEFMKYQNNLNDKNINIFMKDNIPFNILKKIEELLFAQLIPNIKNMVELNVDKRKIIIIVDEFIHKYDYLKKNDIEAIYDIISTNKEEIKKLKNEIKNGFILNSNELENIKEEENKDKILESENIKEDILKQNIKKEILNNEELNKIIEE